MTRNRITTDVIGERVIALEVTSSHQGETLDEHETRLDGHDAWLNQVRGSIRTMVVLWTIAVALLGFRVVQDYVTRPVSAFPAKP